MKEVNLSISQSLSVKNHKVEFHFIDDMKAMFDLKLLHDRPKATKRSTGQRKPKNNNMLRKVGAQSQPKKRRPRNAFILYRTVVQRLPEFKGKTQVELSRFISSRWEKEDPVRKALFERAAELEQGT